MSESFEKKPTNELKITLDILAEGQSEFKKNFFSRLHELVKKGSVDKALSALDQYIHIYNGSKDAGENVYTFTEDDKNIILEEIKKFTEDKENGLLTTEETTEKEKFKKGNIAIVQEKIQSIPVEEPKQKEKKESIKIPVFEFNLFGEDQVWKPIQKGIVGGKTFLIYKAENKKALTIEYTEGETDQKLGEKLQKEISSRREKIQYTVPKEQPTPEYTPSKELVEYFEKKYGPKEKAQREISEKNIEKLLNAIYEESIQKNKPQTMADWHELGSGNIDSGEQNRLEAQSKNYSQKEITLPELENDTNITDIYESGSHNKDASILKEQLNDKNSSMEKKPTIEDTNTIDSEKKKMLLSWGWKEEQINNASLDTIENAIKYKWKPKKEAEKEMFLENKKKETTSFPDWIDLVGKGFKDTVTNEEFIVTYVNTKSQVYKYKKRGEPETHFGDIPTLIQDVDNFELIQFNPRGEQKTPFLEDQENSTNNIGKSTLVYDGENDGVPDGYTRVDKGDGRFSYEPLFKKKNLSQNNTTQNTERKKGQTKNTPPTSKFDAYLNDPNIFLKLKELGYPEDLIYSDITKNQLKIVIDGNIPYSENTVLNPELRLQTQENAGKRTQAGDEILIKNGLTQDIVDSLTLEQRKEFLTRSPEGAFRLFTAEDIISFEGQVKEFKINKIQIERDTLTKEHDMLENRKNLLLKRLKEIQNEEQISVMEGYNELNEKIPHFNEEIFEKSRTIREIKIKKLEEELLETTNEKDAQKITEEIQEIKDTTTHEYALLNLEEIKKQILQAYTTLQKENLQGDQKEATETMIRSFLINTLKAVEFMETHGRTDEEKKLNTQLKQKVLDLFKSKKVETNELMF